MYEGLDTTVFNITAFASCFLALCLRRFRHCGV